MNEDLADLGHTAMLLFAMLPMLADREGRLEDRPRRIKAQLFPYDNTRVETHLDKLVEAGLVRRYEVGGESYIEIVNWSRDQKIHHTEKESVIPEPPYIQQVKEKTVSPPLDNGEKTVKSPIKDGEKPEGKGKGKGKGMGSVHLRCTRRARAASDPCGRIFKHWNSHDALTQHKSLTAKMRSSIQARLKAGHSEGDLCRAISRYAQLCQQEQAPGHNQWGLHQLMSRDEGAWIDRMLNPKYRGIESSRPPPGHTQQSQQNVENVQDWVTRREQHERK